MNLRQLPHTQRVRLANLLRIIAAGCRGDSDLLKSLWLQSKNGIADEPIAAILDSLADDASTECGEIWKDPPE